MPLYECERCGAIDNTACTDFWGRQMDDLEQLCSECETGTWHGEFPKQTAAELPGQKIEYRARQERAQASIAAAEREKDA